MLQAVYIDNDSEYEGGDSSYTDIEQYVSIEEEPEDDSNGQENENQSGESESDVSWPTVDFAALTEINPDIVAWIYIEGTEINYPVVQGIDNQYYLKHLFNGKWNSSGCIFLDSRNTPDFSDRRSIIYGHHKTIVPFCTSGGSGVGSSASNLEQLTGGATWLDGRRLNGGDSQDTVMEWVNSLGLNFGA